MKPEMFYDSEDDCTVQAKDTLTIQMQSLCAFAKALGYSFTVFGNFEADTKYGMRLGFKGCNTIHLNNMVGLHNYPDILTSNVGTHNRPVESLTDIYTANKAIAQKVVEMVYLQGTKCGGVKVGKHRVRFVDPKYYNLFLGE